MSINLAFAPGSSSSIISPRLKYRVVILINSFHPITGGGERQMEELGRALINQGIEVCVVTRRYLGLPAKENLHGFLVYRLSIPVPYLGNSAFWRLLGKLNALSYMFSVLMFLSFPSRTRQIILVQSGLSLSGGLSLPVLASFVRIFHRRTLLVVKPWGKPLKGRRWEPNFGVLRSDEDRKSKLSSLLFRFIQICTDWFVAISDAFYSELIQNGIPENKVVKIPNGVNVDKFKPCSLEEKKQKKEQFNISGKRIVAYVGTLKQKKGVNILLLSWKRVSSLYKDAHLLIIGRTEPRSEFEYLKEQIQELKIEKTVTFVGEVQNVYSYLCTTDVFVLPSFLEGFSNAMLEAMSCGLPVVVTDIPGVREAIVSGVNGILIQPGDPDEITVALTKILSNRGMANSMGRAARKTVVDGYSFDKVVTSYLELFERKALHTQ